MKQLKVGKMCNKWLQLDLMYEQSIGMSSIVTDGHYYENSDTGQSASLVARCILIR